MKTQERVPAMYQALVENIQVGVYVYKLEKVGDDSSLRLIFVNKAAEQFTGVAASDILGKTLDDNFPGLRQKGIPQQFADVARSQRAVVLDDIFYGDERVKSAWFSVKAFPLAENVVGVSFENITERKNGIITLIEQEEYFRTLFHQSPNSLQVMSVDGWMLEVNKAWEELWHAKGENGIGKFNVLQDEQAIAIGFADKFKLATLGEPVDVPEVFFDPKESGFPGRSRWLFSRIYPIKDIHETVKHVIITHIDITGLKETESKLLAHQDELEETVRRRTNKLLEVNDQLQQALSQVKQLTGFLPICSSCKMIRDDEGRWTQIESYIRDHSDADFTHGICPECAQGLYADFLKKHRK